MSYLDTIFGPRANQLNRALSRTSERQALLVHNLANVNTPNYKRQDSDFSITLEESVNDFDEMVANRKLKSKSGAGSSVRMDGNNVDLEYEVKCIAETEQRYNTLTELTSRYFSGLKSVIREGR